MRSASNSSPAATSSRSRARPKRGAGRTRLPATPPVAPQAGTTRPAEDVRTVIEVVRGGTDRGGKRDAHGFGPRTPRRTDGQGRYVQALRTHDVVLCVGPAGTGKTYLAVGWAVEPAAQRPGEEDRARPAGGRGRRAARLSARRPRREDQPVPPAAVRRAQRHHGSRHGQEVHGERHHRDPAARVHAGPHALERLHHSRRGAERDVGADEDVPDADGNELEGRS